MQAVRLESWERPALGALLLVALGLRLHQLDSPLWFDEIMTLVHFVREPWTELAADYSSFNNHLFYSLQAKLFVTAFGEHPWALRLPAVLAGVAGVWLLWRLARQVAGAGEALTVAALLTVSYHHIWFSQNARGYTELMAWGLASLVIFTESFGASSWRRWGLFGVTLAAAVYTHLTALFFIAALGLSYLAALLIGSRSKAVAPRAMLAPFFGFCWGGVLSLILCAPAIPQMLAQVAAVKSSSSVDVMQEYQSPVWALLEGLRTAGGSGLMVAVAPVAAILVVIGAVDIARRRPLIPAVAALHVAITLAVLLLLSMRVWPRFFFTDIALALLFLVRGVFLVGDWVASVTERNGLRMLSRPRLTIAAAAAMILVSAALAIRNYTLPKQNLPAAVALVRAAGAPSQSVGAVGLADNVFSRYPATGWAAVQSSTDLRKLAPYQGRRWLVLIFPNRTRRSRAELMQVVDRDYQIVQRFPGTLGDGGVWVYASKTQVVSR